MKPKNCLVIRGLEFLLGLVLTSFLRFFCTHCSRSTGRVVQFRDSPVEPHGRDALTGDANWPVKIGCQCWTRPNTERLNRPPCYFDYLAMVNWRCRQDSQLHESA